MSGTHHSALITHHSIIPTVTTAPQTTITLNDLLIYMAKQEAVKAEALKPADLERMLIPILNRTQREKFDAVQSVDFGYGVPGVARFRANLYMQRGTVGAVFRRIPIQIMGIDALELPISVGELSHIPDGLVLVTGPTGSGKSTTLAAMISE